MALPLACLSIPFLFLGGSALHAPATGGEKQFTEPMVMLGRCPAFHAQVNGKDALLELDTGSFELRLGQDYMDRQSINSKRVTLQIGDGPVESLRPVVESLAESKTATLADRFATRADGIAGLDILRDYAIGLDFQQGKITFWRHGKLPQEIVDQWLGVAAAQKDRASTALPLTSRNSEDWYRIQARINGRSLSLIFDTGTAMSSVNSSLAAPLHLRKIAETEVEEIGKTEVLSVMSAESLTFGPFSADFPVLNVENTDDADSDGIFGAESLGSGKFLVDLPDSKLYVHRSAQIDSRNPLDARLRSAGLDLFPDVKSRLVVLVKPGSAADKAGVRAGDTVVSIGKVAVQDLVAANKNGTDRASMQAMLQIGMALLQRKLAIVVARSDGSHLVFDVPSIG